MEKIIKEQIEFYYKNSEKVSIEILLALQDKLAVNSYYLAEQYSLAYWEYIDKFYNNKKMKVKSFLSRKASKIEEKIMTDKLREAMSIDDSLTEFSEELAGEAIVEKYKVLLKQINVILQRIQQRISYLKKEKDLTNN